MLHVFRRCFVWNMWRYRELLRTLFSDALQDIGLPRENMGRDYERWTVAGKWLLTSVRCSTGLPLIYEFPASLCLIGSLVLHVLTVRLAHGVHGVRRSAKQGASRR